jgi:hypothetical protein
MNSTKLNGVDTNQFGSLINTLTEKPDVSKATFFVKTEWNSKEEDSGGFCVRSSINDFQIGDQSIPRDRTYTMVFDFPPQFSGEGKGPTVCEACMSSKGDGNGNPDLLLRIVVLPKLSPLSVLALKDKVVLFPQATYTLFPEAAIFKESLKFKFVAIFPLRSITLPKLFPLSVLALKYIFSD